MLGVEIVNLSTFAVTITDFGWTLHNSTNRMAVIAPLFFGGESMPMRLESRTSLTGWAAPGAHQHLAFTAIKQVYATTACGVTRKVVWRYSAHEAKFAPT